MDAVLFNQTMVLFFTLFFMLVGLAFSVVPPLPGTVIMWGAAIFYGLVLGWEEELGWLTFGLLTFLMLAGLIIDAIAGHFGAKMGGASCLAITIGILLGFVLGIVASLIGTPILGCFAGLIGMVGGILFIEWKRNQDWGIATKAMQGYMAGAVAGIMARLTSAILMFIIFLVRVYLVG